MMVAALVSACLNASLIQTTVLTIQTDLPRYLGASPHQTSWVVTATIAAACASVPIVGRLGDLWGRRRVSLWLLAALAVGSAVAAVATSVEVLIASRVLQGTSIGLIPLSVSMMRTSVLADRLPGGLGLISGSLGAGAALGIPVGAALTASFGWQSIFWFSCVGAAVSYLWVNLSVPADGQPSGGKFDGLGATGTLAGSVILVVGIGGVPDVTTGSTRLVLVACGVLLLGATAAHMWRSASPLVDVVASLRRPVLMANLASFFLNFGMMTTLIAFPQILATTHGISHAPILIGGIMMVGGLSQAACAPFLSQATRHVAASTIAVIGCTVSAVGAAAIIPLPHLPAVFLMANVVLGLGFGLAFAAIPRIVMASVPIADIASANGVNAQIRMLGTASAAALVGEMVANYGLRPSPDWDPVLWIACGTLVAAALFGLCTKAPRIR